MKYHGFDSLLRALSLFYLSMIASLIFSCGHHETIEEAVGNVLPLPDSSCMGYFGQPNEKSGLTEAQCASTCQCEQSSYQWSDAPFSSVLFGFHHQNEPEPLSEDPYLSNVQISQGEELACVITVNWLDNSYQLETLRLEDAPPEQITHIGPCGACSSMRDLQVYVENTDLTEPVRRCGIKGISNEAEGLNCLKEMGFSEACGMIWYFNTVNTRMKCLQVCLAHLQSNYVDENGVLNPCLTCDEVESGPVFKAYSGRTRRNSGIPSAICRPCSSISPISHAYLTPP